MKILRMLSIILFMFVAAQGTAQNNSNKKNKERLVGTWKLDYNKTINDIKQGSRQYYDSIKADKKNKVQSSFSQRKIIFSKDGEYTLIANSETQFKGTWKLKDDNVTLEIKFDERTFIQTIENISNSKMTLNLGGNDSSFKRLFDRWYVEKLSN